MQVTGLWRYPVKSMLGERCEILKLDSRGVEGDRLYAVRGTDGKFGSGKNTRRFCKIDRLFGFSAAYADGVPVLNFPDGTTRQGRDADIDEALSRTLDQPVILAREAAVSHFDAGPVHLLSAESLAWLQGLVPNAAIDERRFRPNIVINGGGGRPIERDWIGKILTIGAVTLRVQDETERCGMVTFQQSDLPRAPEVLKVIGRENGLQFGVYAEVVLPGEIRRGDGVSVGGDWDSYGKIL
jgi:uncharacterized protein YcbX